MHPYRLVLLLLLALPFAANAQEPLPNTMCPVMEGEPAVAEHKVVYEGKEIYFCCESCVDDFKANPKAYLSKLPQFEGQRTGGLTKGVSPVGVGLVALALGGLISLLLRKPKEAAPASGGRAVKAAIAVGALLLGVAGALIALTISSLQKKVDELVLRHDLHYATFYDYGYPPVPARPPTEPRLAARFYRGNDERAPELFNGGHYLTSTFDVALLDAEGKKVQHGDDVGDEQLFVELIINRAPHTPDFFFEADRMANIYVTAQMGVFLGSEEDPVLDAVRLTALEPNWKWQARYPVGPFSKARGKDRQQKIFYVAEDQLRDGVIAGPRFHYALQFDLFLDNGVVLPKSDLWMGALYRTRKVTIGKLPLSEWFSHQPIPEKPNAGPQDARLLGLEDDSAPMPPAELPR